jgi:hypothetical protein
MLQVWPCILANSLQLRLGCKNSSTSAPEARLLYPLSKPLVLWLSLATRPCPPCSVCGAEPGDVLQARPPAMHTCAHSAARHAVVALMLLLALAVAAIRGDSDHFLDPLLDPMLLPAGSTPTGARHHCLAAITYLPSPHVRAQAVARATDTCLPPAPCPTHPPPTLHSSVP